MAGGIRFAKVCLLIGVDFHRNTGVGKQHSQGKWKVPVTPKEGKKMVPNKTSVPGENCYSSLSLKYILKLVNKSPSLITQVL